MFYFCECKLQVELGAYSDNCSSSNTEAKGKATYVTDRLVPSMSVGD
jgi:hypothetical protein